MKSLPLTELQEILVVLQRIKATPVVSLQYSNKGICALLMRELVIWRRVNLAPFFKSWKYYSGSSMYPVPSVWLWFIKQDPEEAYNYRNKWKGSYGKLRFNLLDHLVTELTKEVELRQAKVNTNE